MQRKFRKKCIAGMVFQEVKALCQALILIVRTALFALQEKSDPQDLGELQPSGFANDGGRDFDVAGQSLQRLRKQA